MGQSQLEDGPSDAQQQPADTSSPFTAPQISLPKGGGAIRGIDEKFSANPATGTGGLSVPLALSSGRSGFGPQLALSYDSGRGNGAFGIGWDLSLPAITRRTDKGLPRYGSGEPPDIFVLSGAEDLVPVLERDECGGWRFNEFEREGHLVRRYRPRVEGSFARIERWTSLATGLAHWRSITRDNVLTVYGLDENSRIADPANPTHNFSWLICRSYDDRGNAIVYDYEAENDRGVDVGRPSERNRSRTANRYLKRIRYGNRTPLLLDTSKPGFRASHLEPHDVETARWMFEAVFDYGEGHCEESPPDDKGRVFSRAYVEPQSEWAVRRDPFSSYRSGFEVRTYRLCRRVLMFHHFEAELGAPSVLVRSMAVRYREKPVGSFVERITMFGHRYLGDGRYRTRSLPPLDVSYSESPLENPAFDDYRLEEVGPESLENLPAAVGTDTYRSVDLDGEGISGILTEQDEAWFYKPNRGNGRLGAVETVERRPSLANLAGGRQQLMDLSGDGALDLVELAPAAGYYERTENASWNGFRAFRSMPVQDWADPNLRFVDLTGDGIADVLVTEDDAFTWHRSLLDEGFGPAVRVSVPLDEGRGPRVVFADGTQSVYLADVSGDGLSDIVRIRNGEICYWPNLGYGRFGAKIVMENAPWFDDPDLFDQRRIRLADTDGSGTSDILYLGRDGVQVYLNETGNGWSGVRRVRQIPRIDDLTSVTVSDFLGHGTACLIWSSSLPGDFGRQIRYVDLMCGVKPHLLTRSVNNLGAETRVTYASSTQFYLADKAAGKPWVTRLPFPVHVVERVETFDFVSRNRFVTSYTYHHGFYDGREREFRGFGRVDQLDTEAIGALSPGGGFPGATNFDAASSVAPVLTRTWFHTGVFLKGGRVSRHLADEYYREGLPANGEHPLSREEVNAMLLDDTVLPPQLKPEEARETCRALKGSTLRQEIYALDGKPESCRPYSVTESNLTVRLLQPFGPNVHAVVFTHAREQLTFAYERKLYEVDGRRRADPRVSHSVALEVDEYGNVLKSVAVAYPRRLAELAHDFQRQTLITLTENDHTNVVEDPDAYRTPVPAEQRLLEVFGVFPDAQIPGVTNLFRFHELKERVAQLSNGAGDVPFREWRTEGLPPGRRLLKKARTLYRANDLERFLPLGRLQSMALPGESYKLAMPAGFVGQLFEESEAELRREGGYVDLDGNGEWWAPSGRVFYAHERLAGPEHELREAATHFFFPRRYVSPFGNTTSVASDVHDLMPVETTDAVGNVTRAEIDYRVLAPSKQVDPNGNRSEAAFDALGLIAGTAVMGKPGEREGDSLDGFDPDLDPSVVRRFLEDPRGEARRVLGLATTRVVCDVERYAATRRPAFAAMVARETHESDLAEGQQTKTQVHLAFSDGFGREVQKKLQAEPGPVRPNGETITNRWIGSGWTTFNNKGKPVRKYEPFFSASADFEFAVMIGVSPILFYDPGGRSIATLHADHTFEKTVFDAWREVQWDGNDTVCLHPAADHDVGELIARLPSSDYAPTWYAQRITGALGEAEKDAAVETARHADTPGEKYLDCLGRPVLDVVNAGADAAGHPRKYATRTLLDVEGKSREVIDALGRRVTCYDYDMLGRHVNQMHMDVGGRWMLDDVSDKTIRARNSRRFILRTEYDALRRPVRRFVRGGDPFERNARTFPREILFERTIFGESAESELAEYRQRAANLRGRVFRVFDTAGVVTSERYDFKGNLAQTSRQFARDYRNSPDWSNAPVLESERFEGHTTYDALNRVVHSKSADGSVFRPRYNEANLTERIEVSVRAGERGGPMAWTTFVRKIDYDARGERTRIEYESGTTTSLSYDPMTFRLTRMRTERRRDRERFAAQIFADPRTVQDLHYHYDPVGNISQIADRALRTAFHDNREVSAISRYRYDALYRVVEATGREHALQSELEFEPAKGNYRDYPFAGIAASDDPHRVEMYRELFEYDAVGNLLETAHRARHKNWTRHYAYNEPSPLQPGALSNRLSRTRVGTEHKSPEERYLYDADGNVTQMPHLPMMQWDFLDRLAASSRQVVNCGTPETTFYVYDSSGQRARKVTDRANETRKAERSYVGNVEVFREHTPEGEVAFERETLHVMDAGQRIALVETRSIDRDDPLLEAYSVRRFQLSNHLGSSTVELDEAGGLISYEEYSPYGATLFQAGRNSTEVSQKRYRYLGKERDDENGFSFHGARYCAPWLGRWVSCDPVDAVNPYSYCSGNPIVLHDPDGRDERPPEMYSGQVTGEETQDQVREMFAAKGIYYTGDATWVRNESGGGYWHLHTSQIQARDTGSQLNMRADPLNAPSGVKKPAPPEPSHEEQMAKIKAKREEDWSVAKHGMWNAAVDLAAPMWLPPSVTDAVKFDEPKPTGDALRDYELKGNYEGGEIFTNTVVAAASLVPAAEIVDAAQLAAGKMPALTGTGMGGGGQLVTFSEQWAAGGKTAATATSGSARTTVVYQLVDETGSQVYVGISKDYRVLKRLEEHGEKFGQSFRGLQVISEPAYETEAKMLETRLIRENRPILNILEGSITPPVYGLYEVEQIQPLTTMLNPAAY